MSLLRTSESQVITGIPAAPAAFSTLAIAGALDGATAMPSTPWLMRSWTI